MGDQHQLSFLSRLGLQPILAHQRFCLVDLQFNTVQNLHCKYMINGGLFRKLMVRWSTSKCPPLYKISTSLQFQFQGNLPLFQCNCLVGWNFVKFKSESVGIRLYHPSIQRLDLRGIPVLLRHMNLKVIFQCVTSALKAYISIQHEHRLDTFGELRKTIVHLRTNILREVYCSTDEKYPRTQILSDLPGNFHTSFYEVYKYGVGRSMASILIGTHLNI